MYVFCHSLEALRQSRPGQQPAAELMCEFCVQVGVVCGHRVCGAMGHGGFVEFGMCEYVWHRGAVVVQVVGVWECCVCFVWEWFVRPCVRALCAVGVCAGWYDCMMCCASCWHAQVHRERVHERLCTSHAI